MQINNSVRSLILERAQTNSKRGNRADKFHLALVIESGGMRGVAAGGFTKVLSESMLFDAFDTLHGSSAGACAAAYFLTEQADQGLGIYLDDICTRRVVNPFRFLSRPCIVDTDYIVDEVIANKRPLDVDRIISEPGVLNIITTSIADGAPVVHQDFQTKERVLRALKATLRVPGPFEPGVEINNKRHLDGALVAPIPLFSAVAAGATHILVLCTQRTDDYITPRKLTFFEGTVLGLIYGDRLKQSYFAAHSGDRRTLDEAPHRPVKIETLVRPSSATYCGRFTIEKDILQQVERESEKVARTYLESGK